MFGFDFSGLVCHVRGLEDSNRPKHLCMKVWRFIFPTRSQAPATAGEQRVELNLLFDSQRLMAWILDRKQLISGRNVEYVISYCRGRVNGSQHRNFVAKVKC